MEQMEKLFTINNGVDLNSDEDDDVSDGAPISSLFTRPYHVENEVSVALKKTYILYMDIARAESRKIVAGLSDSTSVVYDCETLSKLACLRGHEKRISGVKWHLNDDNLLYTASVDGTVKLWDLRSPTSTCGEFFDDSLGNNKLKPLLCFDLNIDGTFMVAGTELIEGDAFLLFWDVRSPKLLGGYWESHREDVTTVCFHSSKRDWLTSGSVDGLINVFDICKHDEEDAFMYCFNTLSSVNKLNWLSCEREDSVSCITSQESLLLWKVEDASPYCSYSREQLTQTMRRKCADYCYIVDIHETGKEGEQIALCGSSSGRGECLRLLKAENGVLKPMSLLVDNKQFVRTSCYNVENDFIATGGDSGIISLWKLDSGTQHLSGSPLKEKSKAQKGKNFGSNPY